MCLFYLLKTTAFDTTQLSSVSFYIFSSSNLSCFRLKGISITAVFDLYYEYQINKKQGLCVPQLVDHHKNKGFPGGASGKESTCQISRRKRSRFSPWVGKILWRRKWQPAPVFLSGEFHGQRSLVGYSPWGHKESDLTEHQHSKHKAWGSEQ